MIGLDISDRSVKVVQLSRKRDRALQSHCFHVMPEGAIERGVIKDEDVVKRALKESLEQCRLQLPIKDSIVASVPETQSFLRVIEVPIMDDDEIDEAVQWEVSQHIPFGLENVYIDWQPVFGTGHKAAGGRQEVLVGAAQKKVVDPLVALLMSLGLDVAALELESQAIVRALVSGELKRKQGLLIVDLGGSATNVIIHDHGTMRFTAGVQRGGHNMLRDLSEEEQIKVSIPQPDSLSPQEAKRIAGVMLPAQEELVTEVRGVVEFYNSIDLQHEVREILLTGGGSNFPGLDKVFLRFFDNVHVQRGNPWVNILQTGKMKTMPIALSESVHFSTALGLALRKVYE